MALLFHKHGENSHATAPLPPGKRLLLNAEIMPRESLLAVRMAPA